MTAVGSVAPTGNPYIDGLLMGLKWGVNNLTFSFPTDATYYGSSYGSGEAANGFEAFNAQQQAAVRSILASYSSIINFTFTEITETSTQHAELRYAESNLPGTAWAYYPSTSALGGDAWFNHNSYNTPTLGNYAWYTLMHETGHTLGLKHPQTASGAFPVMPLDHDSLEYSVMSYRSYIGAGTGGVTNEAFGYPQSLMMYDIAALQEMYGPNFGTNSGNTVYSWNPVTGQEYIDGVGQLVPGANRIFMTVWDGGGEDTYDFSNYTTNLNVNLAPGGWTITSSAQLAYLGGGHYATGNIANALLYHGNTASLIENAIGGSGHDVIAGNDANNKITGGAGNDTLDGGAGTDTAIYSGVYSNYQIVHNANGSWTVTDLRGGSPDGTDTLTNFEYLQFSDTLASLNNLPSNPPPLQVPTINAFSNDTGTVGDRITSDNTLTFTGSGTAGSTVKIYDGVTLLGTATVDGTGAWTFVTAALSNGAHSFTAMATNTAGSTTQASTALVVTIDTVAPNAPVITGFSPDSGIVGDGITNATTVTLFGTAEAGSVVHIYDGATLLGTATVAANGVWSFSTYDPVASAPVFTCSCPACVAAQRTEAQDAGADNASGGTTLTNGVHAFTVKTVDAAGNSSVFSAPLSVTVDTSAPNVPIITTFSNDSGVAGDGVTNDNTLVLTGTAEAGSTVQVYDGATLLGTATTNGSGAWSFATATLADGNHSFTAKATDAAGNVSTASAVKPVTVDTKAPNAPVITTFSDDSGVAGDGITNDNTLLLTGTAEAGSTVQVYDGATLLGTATANGSGAWSFATATLNDGAHSFTAKATDAAGNVSTASVAKAVTVDTTAPAAPVITTFSNDSGVAGDGITNDNTLVLTGTAEAGSTVQVYDGATLLGTATANGSGAWSFATATLADGAHSFTAKATDATGNVGSASAVLPVTIDTAAPGTTTISAFADDSGVVGDGLTNDNTLVLSGATKPRSTVQIFDGVNLLGSATADANGNWSFATPALSDGVHSFTAKATDTAGNVSATSAAKIVTVDTAAPTVPVITAFSNDSGVAGDGITNDNTLVLMGTAEAGSTVQVYDGVTLLGTATANSSGAWSFATATLADGNHSFTAKATDAAGNTSGASVAKAVTVDTAAPTAPAIIAFSTDSGVAGDGVTNDNTLVLTGTAEAGSTVQVYDGVTLLGTATANSNGAWSFATATLADGNHSFTAKATDVAGNASTVSAAKAVTVDTAAPAAPAITSFSNDSGVIGDGITNDNTLVLTGTAEAGSTVQVYDGATLLGTVIVNGSGAWSFATATLADGAHSFTAKATDAAGNASTASAAKAVTVDTAAPAAPAITSFSNDSGVIGDGITNDNTLVLTGTAEAGSTVQVYDGATLLGTATANSSGAWSFATATLADGAHSFTAKATDAAGNVGSTSAALPVTIDTAAPGTTTISAFADDSGIVGDGLTNDDTLVLSGATKPGSTVQIFDGANLLGTAKADANGNWSFATPTLSDGTHSFTAKSTDLAGNVSATSTARVVTVDTAAPTTPAITAFSNDSGIAGDGVTNDNTLVLTGTAEAGSTVQVYDGATLLGTATANGSGAWSFATATLTDGNHSFTAKATDAAGNISGASVAKAVTVDTAAPTAPVITAFSNDSGVAGDGITNDNTLVLTGTAETGSTVQVYDGATLLGTATANSSGVWNFATATLSDGAHSFTAKATDAAGNVGSMSAALPVTIDTAAPGTTTISAFADDSGVVGDGLTNDNTLVLSGATKAGSTVQIFEGVNLLGSATADTNGNWSFATPTLSDGVHSFTAKATDTAGNVSATSAAKIVTVDTVAPGAPAITAFSNDSGVAGDGITNDNTLLLIGTAEAGSTVQVYDGVTLLGTATANSSGAWSFATATLADGNHSFTAKAMDSAGNISTASAVKPVTVDTKAPNAPVITTFSDDSGVAGDGITNDNTLLLTGTAEAGSTVQVYDGATLLGTATANGSGAWSFATATLTDGNHSFTAKAMDSAGNVSGTSAAKMVTVDTAAPTAPAITAFSNDSGVAGDGITNDNTLVLIGTAEAGSTVQVYDGATLLGTATANSSGAWSFATATLNDGAHSFTAKATDAAGNVGSTSAALPVTIDTAAPGTTTISAFADDSGVVGDGLTNDNTLLLSGATKPGSTVQIFDGANLLGSVTADTNGNWSFATPTLSDGVHSFTAKATDTAGNVSGISAAKMVTVDTAAPTAPVITTFSDDSGVAGDGVTNDNTLVLTGTAEAGSTVQVYDGATLLGTATANGSGAWSFATPALSDGVHSFTAKATDTAGNVSATSAAKIVTVDTAAPTVPVITAFSNDSGIAGDGVTNDNTLVLTGTAEAGSTVQVYDGATLLGTATANGSGAWSFATATLVDGSYSFTAKATDVAGNTSSTSSVLPVTIDTAAPGTTTISTFADDSGVVGDGLTNDNTLVLSGATKAGSTVQIFDGANLLGSATADTNGNWSFATSALSDGVHSFTAKATDTAGNVSGVSAAKVVTVDTAAPTAPVITAFSNDSGVAGDGITNDNTLLLTGTAEAGSTVQVYDGATLLGTATANGSGAWSFATATLNDGAHSFTAKATDAAGNASTVSAAKAVTVDTTAPTAPAIIAFSTDSGVIGDGITNDNTLLLTGTAEAGSTVQVYDGVTLLGTATANGSGTWSFTTGALPDGTHSFTAKATDIAGNTSGSSISFGVTVDTTAPTAPALTGIGTSSDDLIYDITNTDRLIISGTSEANSTVQIYDGATLLGTTTANSNGVWSFATAPLIDGNHSFSALAIDTFGNASQKSAALSVDVDTMAPGAPTLITTVTPENGITNDDVIQLAGTAEANTIVYVYDGAALIGASTVDVSGKWSFITPNLADGVHSFIVKAQDIAGNVGDASLPLTVTVDTIAPVATIKGFSHDSGLVGDGITNVNVQTLTGAAEAHSLIEIWDGGALLGKAVADADGLWNFSTGVLADGQHSFSVKGTDQAGNSGTMSQPLKMTVDTDAPDTTVTSFLSNSSGAVSLRGLADANSTITIYESGKDALLGTVTADASGKWSYLTSALADGASHNLLITATDIVGNVGTNTQEIAIASAQGGTFASTSASEQFSGGKGADKFVFAPNFGNDVIFNFQLAGTDHDVVEFSHTTFADFAEVLSHATQLGTDVVIADGGGNSVTLKNVSMAKLQYADIHII